MSQIRHLVQSVAVTGGDNQVIALQACTSLKAVFEEEGVQSKISPFIGDIIARFSEYLESVEHNAYFETMQEIIKYSLLSQKSAFTIYI